jgi:hypothetical protein
MRETSDYSTITGIGAEPTVGELLADPLTRAMMRADRLDAGAVAQMLRSVAGRLRAGGGLKPPSVGVKLLRLSKPSISGYLSWTALDRPSPSATARSAQVSLSADVSGPVCGSICSW